jgi:hypothetical protein
MLVVLALAAVSACTQAATPPVPISEAVQTREAPTQLLPLATPISQEPAAGICASFDGELIEIRINADIPDPRCARVTPGQRLKVINATAGQIQVRIGPYEAEIDAGGEHHFDIPFGQYIAPGVHLLQVRPCCGPELWLVEE